MCPGRWRRPGLCPSPTLPLRLAGPSPTAEFDVTVPPRPLPLVPAGSGRPLTLPVTVDPRELELEQQKLSSSASLSAAALRGVHAGRLRKSKTAAYLHEELASG